MSTLRLLAIATFALLPLGGSTPSLQAQSIVVPASLSVSESEFFQHMKAPSSVLTDSLSANPHDFYVAVKIDKDGNVTSVVPDYPCSQDHGCVQMCNLLHQQKFKPFEIKGKPVQAIANLHFTSKKT
jgi:hypothetical protein